MSYGKVVKRNRDIDNDLLNIHRTINTSLNEVFILLEKQHSYRIFGGCAAFFMGRVDEHN